MIEIAGKGVFSCVVRASDELTQGREVAIKIMRTKFEIMRVSGEKEKEIVSKLNAADPFDRKHCIQLLDSFNYN